MEKRNEGGKKKKMKLLCHMYSKRKMFGIYTSCELTQKEINFFEKMYFDSIK